MSELSLEVLRSQSKLFSLLDEAGQRRLLAVAGELDGEVADAIVREGEFGDSFFLVLEGELSVRIGGLEEACEVARLVPGSLFGEIAALLGEARSASVVCQTPCKLLRFEAPRVQGILKDYPKIREVLVKLGLHRAEKNLQQMMESDFPAARPPSDGTAEGSSSWEASERTERTQHAVLSRLPTNEDT